MSSTDSAAAPLRLVADQPVYVRKQARARVGHRGVRILTLKDGRTVARWTDPITRRAVQKDLLKLDLTTDKMRRDWCIQLAKTNAQQRARLIAGGTDVKQRTVKDAVSQFLAEHSVETQGSLRHALHAMRDHLATIGVHEMHELRPHHLYQWSCHAQRAKSNPWMRSTQAKGLRSCARFVGWCRRFGMTPFLSREEVADSIKPPKGDRPTIRVLKLEEIRALLTAALAHDALRPGYHGTKVAPLLLCALLTGCRRGELLGLHWSEIDFHAGMINLAASRVKTKQERSINLDVCPMLVELLRKMRETRTGPLVFDVSSRAWDRAWERLPKHGAPSNWSLHDLRKTCESVLLSSSLMPVLLVAERTGHSLVIAAKHYAKGMQTHANARTIEEACGITDLAQAIIDRI